MKPAALVRLTLSVAVIGLVAACAASRFGDDPTTDVEASQPAASRPPFETAPPASSTPNVDAPDGVPAEVWAAIMDALEQQFDGEVDPSAVRLVSVEAMTWSDGSLGCPRPGEMYTQALVDGVRVVVDLGGTEYDYRVPNGGEPRLCESPPRGD